MIIIDTSQIVIATIIDTFGPKLDTPDLMRHVALNSIRANVRKFRNKYGKSVVLALDNKDYWRKDIFPFYKAHRTAARQASDIDWKSLYKFLDTFKEELKLFMPYKVIEVPHCEADDVIAVIANRVSPFLSDVPRTVVVSDDHDFKQLQTNLPNIDLFAPSKRVFISSIDPVLDKWIHILKGDRNDGIPNVLSPSDTFVMKVRQKTMTEGRLDTLLQAYCYKTVSKDLIDETVQANVQRNRNIIDFNLIPEDIENTICETFDAHQPVTRREMLNYLTDFGLSNLLDVAEDF